MVQFSSNLKVKSYQRFLFYRRKLNFVLSILVSWRESKYHFRQLFTSKWSFRVNQKNKDKKGNPSEFGQWLKFKRHQQSTTKATNRHRFEQANPLVWAKNRAKGTTKKRFSRLYWPAKLKRCALWQLIEIQ